MERVSDVYDDSWLLQDVLRAVLARTPTGSWTVEDGEFWCSLVPPEHRRRAQGWKLHVSATQLSAPIVLARVAAVLLRAGCAFKFARTLDDLGDLLSNRCDRRAGGKFITAYPADDDQLRRLADELDDATDGLPGPRILSDRPLRPGSLVHYRYGVFEAPPVFTDNGVFVPMLTHPDGSTTVDSRPLASGTPAWPASPFPGPPADPRPEQQEVLIGDRYVVREAIRHSFRGGVFLATDRQSGAEVVVKQARPHVMASLTGGDGRDLLRHEAEMLDLLGPLGLAPHRLALTERVGNVFLVQELVPGVTLREWVAERASSAWQGGGAPLDVAVDVGRRLVALVSAVHAAGLVLCDLKPANIMVRPDGRLVLVDLEYATPTGSRVVRGWTPGYAGPERTSAPWFGPAPAQRSDLYSLGATLLFLVSGVDPPMLADEPSVRSPAERLSRFVVAAGVRMAALRRLAPLLLGLTRDDPDERWALPRALEFLAAIGDHAATADPDAKPACSPLPAAMAHQLIVDGLAHLVGTMTPQRPSLWQTDRQSEVMDPCSAQFGAAGPLAVLTRAARVLGRDDLRAAVATVAGWLDDRRFDIPRLLPGLYFGRSGTAWALYEAARFLDDEALVVGAIELARRLPAVWPNPDVCHGTSGAGLALVHLWRATGDAELHRRLVQCADGVLAAARERGDQLLWPVPDSRDPTREALVHYGFAHGVAGVGAFLLACGNALGRPEYVDVARRAGDTLRTVADREGRAAWWPRDEHDKAPTSRLMHWCSGASGVGTFLIRLWAATGDPGYRELAEAAAVAVRRDAWSSPVAVCHGLAGEGEFLLDLAHFTGDGRYREWAAELAAVMHAQHALRDGLALLPDDTRTAVSTGYGTGLSGALGFLLRLRYGGPRLWMPDDPDSEVRTL